MPELFKLLVAASHIVLAYWVWQSKSKHTSLRKSFIAFSLVTALWLLTNSTLFFGYDLNVIRVSYAVGSLMTALAVIWILFFSKRMLSSVHVLGILGFGLLFFIAALLPDGVARSLSLIRDNLFAIETGSLYYYYITYAGISVAIMLWSLISAFLRSQGIYREQVRYILIGTIAFGGELFISNAFFPYIGYPLTVFFDTLGALVFTFLAAYAIVRYRFLDVKIVLRKGTAYAVTVTLALGLYLYIVFLGSRTAENIFGFKNDFSNILAVLLIALGFHPLRKWVEYILNAYFFPKRIDLREVGKKLNEQLTKSITENEKVLQAIREEVQPTLGVQMIDLFIQKEPAKWEAVQLPENKSIRVINDSPLLVHISQQKKVLVTDEIDFYIEETRDETKKDLLLKAQKLLASQKVSVVVPIFNPEDLIGILFLGPKHAQTTYTIEDVQFLKNLQQDLGHTLSGVILYYQAIKRIREKFKA